MNIYFLVEGKQTEKKVYPHWLYHLVPNLKPASPLSSHKAVIQDNYCLISGKGYPRLLDDALEPAIQDINESGLFDFLVVCLDSEGGSVEEKISEVAMAVQNYGLLPKTELKVIVQNCCFETWFLGNRRAVSHQPSSKELSGWMRHFNVAEDDPEEMFAPFGFRGTRAHFHLLYLQALLKEKQIHYSKEFPREVIEAHYLDQLCQRIADEPSHLKSFQSFLEFCERLRPEAA